MGRDPPRLEMWYRPPMGLGALVVVGVLFAAGFYLPRRLQIHAGEGKAAFPAQPSAGSQQASQPSRSPADSSVAAPSAAPASSAGGVAAQSSQTSEPEKTGPPAADASSGAVTRRVDAAGNSKRSSNGSQGTQANLMLRSDEPTRNALKQRWPPPPRMRRLRLPPRT